MTVYIKELKQSLKSWCIWTGAIAFMLLICVLMFPSMKGEMDSVSDMFSNMGSFTAAFGMDKLNFGDIMGFYGIECGNVLSIGGGFFAALAGISVLAKEEKDRTAEFLFTHPISRFSILTQKLISVLTQVTLLNAVVVAVSAISFVFIGETVAVKEFMLLHVAYYLLQIEIACICFGISAFIKRGSLGIGLGLAITLYFLNIVCNISEDAEFLKYITPYAYTEASEIISKAELNAVLLLIGLAFSAVGVAIGYVKYVKKDLAS